MVEYFKQNMKCMKGIRDILNFLNLCQNDRPHNHVPYNIAYFIWHKISLKCDVRINITFIKREMMVSCDGNKKYFNIVIIMFL